MVSAKMLINLTDVICAKETQQGAGRLLNSLLETCVDRLHTMTVTLEEQFARLDKVKNGEQDNVDSAFIENAKPVGGAAYAAERPENLQGQSGAHDPALHPHLTSPFRVPKSISHTPTWISLYSTWVEKMRRPCT